MNHFGNDSNMTRIPIVDLKKPKEILTIGDRSNQAILWTDRATVQLYTV